MGKLINPDRSNRAESIDAVWRRLSLEEAAADDTSGDLLRAQSYMDQGRVPQAALAVGDIARVLLYRAIIDRRSGQEAQAMPLLRQAFGYFYWAEELFTANRQAKGVPDSIADDLLHGAIAWQSLSVACGSDWFAQWVAPHLHNQFAQPAERPSLLGYSLDLPARRFMAFLQRAIITGAWPAEIDTASMSGYGRLLAALAKPDAFEQALIDFCDWRVANALGFPEMGSTKRRRQSDGWSALDRPSWEQAFPIELQTLKYAYGRATAQSVSLDSPHPLLQGHLVRDPSPALEPLWEDELTAQLANFWANLFGNSNGLRSPAEARYL